MPLYDYSGENTIKVDGQTILSGKRFETDEYVVGDDFNLVSHLPQVDPPPFKTLYNNDIVVGVVENVEIDQHYGRLNVYNICGGILKVYANEDPVNYFIMPNNTFYEIKNIKGTIGELHLSGESSGNVQITADQNI